MEMDFCTKMFSVVADSDRKYFRYLNSLTRVSECGDPVKHYELLHWFELVHTFRKAHYVKD